MYESSTSFETVCPQCHDGKFQARIRAAGSLLDRAWVMLVQHAEAITIANGGIDRWGWFDCGSPEIVAESSSPAVPFDIGQPSFLAMWSGSNARYNTGMYSHTNIFTGYTVAALGAIFDGTASNHVVSASALHCVGASPMPPQ